MPRVLFLLTGGTISMKSGKGGVMRVKDEARDFIAEVPALARIADIETKALFRLDSADMQPEHWLILAREIHAALAQKKYDGIVVAHGTDTMAYTASALAFLLGPVPKPVILTGAQKPLAEARTDARENLINATLAATLAVPEVAVAFATHVLRGVRTTKHSAWALDAFDSPNAPPLVELGLGVSIGAHVRKPGKLGKLDDRIDKRVLAVRVFPGLDPALVEGAIRVGVKGLVLQAYGTGTLPHLSGSLIPALDVARANGVPVLVTSQCRSGFVELERYEGGVAARKAGAIPGGDMTVEAALAKMMIGLGRYGGGKKLRAYLESDVAGEVTT
ncbi:MAG: asparaginase [Polyangiaceae bacterium]